MEDELLLVSEGRIPFAEREGLHSLSRRTINNTELLTLPSSDKNRGPSGRCSISSSEELRNKVCYTSHLLTNEEHEHFCVGHREKKTWELPGLDQEKEVAAAEEEEGVDEGALAWGNGIPDKTSDGHHILVSLLKDCAAQKDIDRGRALHIEIVKKGLIGTRVFVCNTLIDMYAKCGMLADAEDVFRGMPFRTVVSWTALIAGYVQNGHAEDALQCFEQMWYMGFTPNQVTYLCILKACAHSRVTDKCREMHLRIVEDGLENDMCVGTALVDMYAKCGYLEQAKDAFNKISVRSIVSFGALLSAFVQHDCAEEALECFEQMQHEGVQPNAATFISVCKACGSMKDVNLGKGVHLEVVKVGNLDKDVMLANAFLDMYAKCGALIDAQNVFDNLHFRNLVSWNSLITGYAQHGNREEDAFYLLEEMQIAGFSPDLVTYIGILKACGTSDGALKGQQIHIEVLKLGLFEAVGNALAEMYCKCGLLAEARSVFDRLPAKSIILWNVLITGYAQHGHSKEALRCFDEMQIEGFSPNALTLTSILNACTTLGAVDKGQEIHSRLDREGLLDVVACTALIDLYAKCGLMEKAQQVFDKLSVRDLVSWSALITGYAEEGHGEEALECYGRMQLEGISPNAITFLGLLKACGSIGAAFKGRETHAEILRRSCLEKDILVGTSLIDMYGKCGLLREAKEVFCKLPARNIISWNALIAGYSQIGEVHNVFRSYHAILHEGLRPSIVTFTILFNTCSHAGLLDRGQLYFEVMNTNYGIFPTLEHYNCMIDIFGRAGQLEKAVAVVETMSSIAAPAGWHIMLTAFERYEPDAEAFVRLTNMYTETGICE